MNAVTNSTPTSPVDAALQSQPYLTAALYKFVDLPDYRALREPLLACCEAHQVKGTLLLASEGINGTIAGPEAGVRAVLAHLHADPRLASLQHKEAWADKPPFLRMKVRLKKEIVTLRVPELDPNRTVGQYVKPQDWNALLADPEGVVIDTRNDYEVVIGTFKGAINPNIKTFTELPAWLDAQPALQAGPAKKTKVAMFCTGGIRCEKSTAYLKEQGFDEVYHLEGGILQYLEDVPKEESLWEGDCFVFDNRVAVNHNLEKSDYHQCYACRLPITDEDMQSKKYESGVSCPHCFGTHTEDQLSRFREREKQVNLAKMRKQEHVGTEARITMEQKREEKARLQRERALKARKNQA